MTMNELDILRLQYAAPLATLSSFTEVQKAGAARVLAAVDALSEERETAYVEAASQLAWCVQFDVRDPKRAKCPPGQLLRAVRELAHRNEEHRSIQCTKDTEIARLTKCASDSDSHASAMEEATMRAQPAVYVTDIEAMAEAIWQLPYVDCEGRGTIAEIARKFARPLSREALAKVIADAYWDDSRAANDVDHVVDAVLSFIGARAVDSQASRVVGESRSGDASKLPQHEGASPDSSAARASLAEAARAKMDERGPKGTYGDITRPVWMDVPFPPDSTPRLEGAGAEHLRSYAVSLERTVEALKDGNDKRDDVIAEHQLTLRAVDILARRYGNDELAEVLKSSRFTPAPQESDVAALKHAIDCALDDWSMNDEDSRSEADVCRQACMSWFRAHRVVELPRLVHKSVPWNESCQYGFDMAIRSVKSALSRAGVAFTEAK